MHPVQSPDSRVPTPEVTTPGTLTPARTLTSHLQGFYGRMRYIMTSSLVGYSPSGDEAISMPSSGMIGAKLVARNFSLCICWTMQDSNGRFYFNSSDGFHEGRYDRAVRSEVG